MIRKACEVCGGRAELVDVRQEPRNGKEERVYKCENCHTTTEWVDSEDVAYGE